MASIMELATRIAANAGAIDFYLKSNDFKAPSFDEDADDEFPNPQHDTKVEKARVALIEDTKSLRDLIMGPSQVLRELCWSVCLGASKLFSPF
jgi:hypothetical protein